MLGLKITVLLPSEGVLSGEEYVKIKRKTSELNKYSGENCLTSGSVPINKFCENIFSELRRE